MTSLLDQARDVLGGLTQIPNGQSARVAAFLIRQALEDIVHLLCEKEVGHRLDHPVRMQSRLIVLRTFSDTETARATQGAWMGLSNACHHHAYELSPTISEIRHLLALVTALERDLDLSPTLAP